MAGINISEEFFKKFGKKFPPESYLAREGEPGDTMFIISTGKVSILKRTSAGEKALATISDGDFFGEMALMGVQDKRAASVKTLTETTVLELNKVAFESLIRRSPEIAMKVIATLAERLRDSNAKTTALIHKDDNLRIASYINSLVGDKGVAAPVKGPDGEPFGRLVVLKREAVAGALGLPVEAIDRFLALARKVRFIGQNGDWIWVPYPSYIIPLGTLLSKL
jgi:CRP/FNR family cyclic AMP-dependent transcriptional regulator